MLISMMSLGCSSDGGSSSWCRSGSFFPSRAKRNTETVYMHQGISQCDPCAEVSACDPCNPCQPCEPVCNPCDMSCTGGIVGTGTITPHPL